MGKIDLVIILLFIVIIVLVIITWLGIHNFSKILNTCSDDFEVINNCGCVPCEWSDAEKYSVNNVCLPTSLEYGNNS